MVVSQLGQRGPHATKSAVKGGRKGIDTAPTPRRIMVENPVKA